MNIELIIFLIFSALVLISAIGVVTVNNPVKSAINLVFTFFSSAVLWLLLNAEFLSIILILVYVGAVMVPAMLSVAQTNNLSGQEFLRGLAIGSELICRLALVAPTAVHRQGFHPTAIFGAFGSSIGVSSVIVKS